MLSHTGVQPRDPEFPEFPLFDFAITIGVLPRFFETTDGNSVAAVGSAPEAFGLLNYSFVLREEWLMCWWWGMFERAAIIVLIDMWSYLTLSVANPLTWNTLLLFHKEAVLIPIIDELWTTVEPMKHLFRGVSETDDENRLVRPSIDDEGAATIGELLPTDSETRPVR